KFKIIGQVFVGLIVGCILYFHDGVVVKEKVYYDNTKNSEREIAKENGGTTVENYYWKEGKSTLTTIPFVKNNEFDYSWLLNWMGDNAVKWSWLIFIPVVILIVPAVSNGANMTDGLDGWLPV